MDSILLVAAPLAGTAIALSEVPDPVFAESMVGPGAAVDPERGPLTVFAPIAGMLVKLKPHAFVVTAPNGKGVLVHLGIDTVNFEGNGFELFAEEGATLVVGAPVVRWNPARVAAAGLSPICPVIALDAPLTAVNRLAAGPVAVGTPLFNWV
jgi:PTS system glucose-specific IIA component